MRETKFTTNVRNWRIEDYITKHIELYSILDDQKALGTHKGTFENRRVDLLLNGLKNKKFVGLKSNIMCHLQLCNDFNATATHLKYMVNRMPELQTAPGRQVSAMGRGGGRGRGTGRGGHDGCGGHEEHGGRGFDMGRGHHVRHVRRSHHVHRGQCHGHIPRLFPYQTLGGQGLSVILVTDSPYILGVSQSRHT